MSGPRVLHRIAIAATLLAIAYGGYRYRRVYIASFFAHGPEGRAPALARPDVEPTALPPAARTRVALLDGVGLETARRLPAYSAACARGLDLIVDVGFPTVSLPVQRALWTGLSQQQTGFEFVIRQAPPHPDNLPGQIPGSVAIANAHREIIDSLGFATTIESQEPAELERAALEVVTGDSPLAFVHLLWADAAGHKQGAASEAYRQGARDADAILGRLLAATGDDARWFVLSDHGHRPAGGHGGAEPEIRRVRACIAGAIPAALAGPPGRAIHLVDFARAIADSTGARLNPASAGRPLGVALAAPVPAAGVLPRPAPAAWIAAALILALAIAATAWAARGRIATLPWWWPVAYLSVLWIEQAPTLSVPMVYPPLGRTMYVAALPGLGMLAVLATLALRDRSPGRVAVAQLALPFAAAAAALALAGVGSGGPPLMPAWTARASLYLVLGFTGAAVVALAVLASAVRRESDRTRPSRTRDSAA